MSSTRDDQWVAGWVESKTQERMMAGSSGWSPDKNKGSWGEK